MVTGVGEEVARSRRLRGSRVEKRLTVVKAPFFSVKEGRAVYWMEIDIFLVDPGN